MESLALLIQLWPLLSGLIINGAVLGLAVYGRRATGLRSFTLLIVSSAIHVAMTVPAAYGQYLLRSDGVAAYGRFATWQAGAGFVSSMVSSFLFIGAVLWFVEDVRRLQERAGASATLTPPA